MGDKRDKCKSVLKLARGENQKDGIVKIVDVPLISSGRIRRRPVESIEREAKSGSNTRSCKTEIVLGIISSILHNFR